MNGEIYNACNIVASAKKALLDNADIVYIPVKDETQIEFCFLPKGLFRKARKKVLGVSTWYKECLKKGLQDIKFLTLNSVENRNLLGASGMTHILIVCYYSTGEVTFFTPKWRFISGLTVWHVLYEEHIWVNPPRQKPEYENPTVELQQVLAEIETFAGEIGYPSFADKFHKAGQALRGIEFESEVSLPRLNLPAENLKLFLAAQQSYVFGGMGSWNDSPPWKAHEKGLDEKYEELSSRLHTQMINALLFAVNEW
ncbi:MAG: hypothetical protein LBO63_08775 [Oscillospiraceae bacterium]|nr:hypothetical protein [Oscillospiraceae bacterium]